VTSLYQFFDLNGLFSVVSKKMLRFESFFSPFIFPKESVQFFILYQLASFKSLRVPALPGASACAGRREESKDVARE
jgi:hypothetical protein